jgi:hypothetical protein
VRYKLEKAGLVVYTSTWKREQFIIGITCALIAIAIITLVTFATGGAALPAYALLFI